MIRTRRVAKPLVMALLVTLFSLPAGIAWAVPFEQALPEDCIVFVNVANIAELKADAGRTRAMQLYQDPAMRPFVDPILKEVDRLVDRLHQEAGINVRELASLPTGQFAAGLRLHPANPDDPPYLFLLLDVSTNAPRVQSLLDQFSDRLESQQGMSKRKEGEFTVLSKKQAKPRQQLCYTLKGGILAVGNDPESLGAVVSALEGGRRNALAGNGRFQAFREQAGGPGDIEIFVDISKIITVAVDKAPPQAAMGVTLLGLNAFQSAGISVSLVKGEYESMAQAALLTRGQSTLLNLLNMPSQALKPESWVPQDIASYASFTWDLDLFYDTLSGIVNGINPNLMEQIDRQLAQFPPDNPLITGIKSDVIGPLGNRLSVLTDLSESRGMPVSRVLLAWQLDNADKLRGTIDRLIGLAGGALPLQTKTVKGHTVYTFPLGELLATQAPDQDMPIPVGNVGLAVSKSHLLLATHVELLDKALNSSGSGLAESRDYRRIASKFPGKTSGVFFARADQQAESTWKMVKSGQLTKLLRQLLSQGDAERIFGNLVDAVNGQNLPALDSVRTYLAPSGGYLLMDERGVRLVQFSLK